MKIFNSMTGTKEEFHPLHEGKVSMYVCGPTVYNHAHIGNTRPMIVFDLLQRVFIYRGYEVTFVSNYTDVDDKIIKAAKEEGITEKELTEKYIAAYEDIRKNLNLIHPTYTPRVTETMGPIISFVESLIEKGFAYEKDGDVYFRVHLIGEYGKLSGIRKEDLLAGASQRVEQNDKKESPMDFALWKKTDEGIQFDSPWSKGRPGWHTECVVMINDIFPQGRIDIHGGGYDLKFPHHENEIAQSIAYQGHDIADYWMHNQMLTIDNEKMSKSLGNVIWAKDYIEKLGVNDYKWLMLSTHYRNTLNIDPVILHNVHKEVSKIENVMKQYNLWMQLNGHEVLDMHSEATDHFVEALEDDLNTSLAMSIMLEQVKLLNQLYRKNPQDHEAMVQSYSDLVKMIEVFGLVFDLPTFSSEQIARYNQWQEAKKAKNFELADTLRAQLMEDKML